MKFLRFLILSTCLLALACAHTEPAVAPRAPVKPVRRLFEFHSDPWLGLHQRLLAEASIGMRNPTPTCACATDGDHVIEAWASAVAFYRTRFAGKDPLFDDELMRINQALALAGDAKELTSEAIPSDVKAILAQAFAIYREKQWPEDDVKNRALATRAEKLLTPSRSALADQVALRLETVWPTAPVRVELAPVAGWAPAYTVSGPILVTMANSDSRNDGDALLELLFHEASHGMTEVLDHDLWSAFAAKHKPLPDGLDHAILFYTTGELVKRELGPSYVPYAYKRGLYERGWQNYERALRRDWQPWLDGKITLEAALEKLAEEL